MFLPIDFDYISEFLSGNEIAMKCLEAIEFAMNDSAFEERRYEDEFDIDSEFTLHVGRREEDESVWNTFYFTWKRKGDGLPVHYEEIMKFCEVMVCLEWAKWKYNMKTPGDWRFKVYIE